MPARLSAAVVGAYAFLLLLIALVLGPRSVAGYLWVPYFLGAVTVFFLVRYLSTRYTIDDSFLRAWRILGGRRIPLEEIRGIEFANFRDLSPTGSAIGLGAWGWRGRVFSPVIGEFDAIFTEPAHGLLVTAGTHPLFLSPRHPEEFARELSRRVRSYTGPLLKDVGAPAPAAAPPPAR